MKKSRPISLVLPIGILKMTLWAGTEDEESFTIKGLRRGTPHVVAYGVKYYLTEKEIRIAQQLEESLH